MNEYFNENKRTLFLFIILLVILGAVLYFMILRPVQSDVTAKEKFITSTEDEIVMLEATLTNLKAEDTDFDELIYENRIPKARELDEYIRSLEQMEIRTDSHIEKIDFVYDSDFAGMEDEEEDDTDTSDDSDTSDNDANDEEDTDEEADTTHIDQELMAEKPDNLEALVVKVTAAAPDYDAFIDLLETIENEERISIVTHMHFNNPTEQELLFDEDPEDTIQFEAELTTFYYAP